MSRLLVVVQSTLLFMLLDSLFNIFIWLSSRLLKNYQFSAVIFNLPFTSFEYIGRIFFFFQYWGLNSGPIP
jgi:hypothetical protein